MIPHTFTPAAPARWAELTADAKEAAVRALAGTGLTSSAMAEVLATTKNAVLGLANRRGIQIGADVPVTAYSARVARPAFALGREVPASTWTPLHPSTPSPTRKECCWPVGEATGSNQQYCGGPRARGSYCSRHAAMAFRPGNTEYAHMLRSERILATAGVEPGITAAEALAVVLPKGKKETEE